MIKIQTPGKYIQGPKLLDELGSQVKYFGDRFIVLASNTPLKLKKESIEYSFLKEGLECKFEKFNGEVSYKEINRIIELLKEDDFDAVIGLGGGKVIDTAKVVANRMEIPVIVAPTIASSDAPCSSVAVIYGEDGNVCGVESFIDNPNMVLLDTDIIVNAPSRLLVAGIGDAMATYFEAKVCYDYNYKNTLGTNVSETALGLARLCYELILKYAYQAKLSADLKVISKAFESIVEVNTYLSGAGFENGGLSCAHSIQDALTAIPECHEFLHGERVAFGTFCLLIIEDYPEDIINEFLELCYSIGLPITLKELGLVENVEGKLLSVMNIAFVENNPVYNMPPSASMDIVYSSILLADKIGTEFLMKKDK